MGELTGNRANMTLARILLLVLSLAPAVARAEAPPPREVQIKLTETQMKTAGIEMRPVNQEKPTDEIVVPATIAVPPNQLRVVAAPAAGLVEAFLVSPDEDVAEGAPIAHLRSQDLVEAQRAFLAAVAEEALASEKLRRDQQLHRERIIAERRLLTTRAEAALARATLDERRQLLGLHGMSEDDIAQLRKDRRIASAIVVRAPIAGVVLQRHVTAGERVAASAPLVTIARLNPIWANLQVPLVRAGALTNADKVVLPGLGLEGRLLRVSRSADSATQSVIAVAEFSPGLAVARPGQAVQAIVRTAHDGARQWRVPAVSVVHSGGREWIFLRNEAGFRAVTVELVAENTEFASIRANLRSGDSVAARGILALLQELNESLEK